MLGWLSAEAARASFSKRFRREASPATSAGRTLTATSRARRVSRDRRHTSPIPPAPRAARISYGPRRAPAEGLKRSPQSIHEVEVAETAPEGVHEKPRIRRHQDPRFNDSGRIRRPELTNALSFPGG